MSHRHTAVLQALAGGLKSVLSKAGVTWLPEDACANGKGGMDVTTNLPGAQLPFHVFFFSFFPSQGF